MKFESQRSRHAEVGLRLTREVCAAIALGALPVLIQAESASELKKIVEALLTGPFLMGYYAVILVTYMLATCIRFRLRFSSSRYQSWLIAVHGFLGEIASGFLTTARTGLGVMLGFGIVWHRVEPDSFIPEKVVEIALLTLLTIFLSASLAFCEDMMRDPRKTAALGSKGL